jgi:ABC-type antimicrobial peptide transport system permease subunit
VGVAEDGKYHDLIEPAQPALFVPLAKDVPGEALMMVRSELSSKDLAPALRLTLGRVQPGAPISVRPWPDALVTVLFPARAATVALGLMGLFAVMLAMTGIFGMAAYGVSRRLRDLGIRMALGARWAHVVLAAVGRPVVLLAVGSVLGLLAGVSAGGFLGRIVYEADSGHPAVLAGAALTMALIGIAGCAIPAVRALGVDPSKLMRDE